MSETPLSDRAVQYVQVFRCRECDHRNRCHTKLKWERPPTDCVECGARDWERAEAEVLGA